MAERERKSRVASRYTQSFSENGQGDQAEDQKARSARRASSGRTVTDRESEMNIQRASKKRRRRKKQNWGLIIFLSIVLMIAIAIAVFVWKRYSPSDEMANLNEYYGIENENQLAIIVDDQIVDQKGMISEGKAYVSYEVVRDYINGRFYWDPDEGKLLYTLPADMLTVEANSSDYSISKEKNSAEYVILKTDGNTAYIALDFIRQYTDIEYEVYDHPQRVSITCDWSDKQVVNVKKNTQVRVRGGVKSPILTQLKKKDQVIVLEEESNWKKVLTADGFIGYVRNRDLGEMETRVTDREFIGQEFVGNKKDYTINMAWHNVTNSTANNSIAQRIADSKGLTTIVPTWFHVLDVNGNLDSIASADYVNYAHQNNIEVWAAIRDFDGGINSNDESLALLRSTAARENLINQLISAALQVGVDGINVDFEKISQECGEHYIQFIRELSVRCRQSGLVLSIDNYVPKGYNRQYNRKEQGIVADYVVIMGYDEHFGGSPEAGPVSSYNFVKEGIEETLKEVPADKIISGIPFFTRLWAETPKTAEELAAQAGTEAADYTMNVTSEALGMATANEKITQAGAQITQDPEAGQNYATWEADGVTYEIWLEDASSIEAKLKLMKEHGLAGTAAWAIGQESPEIWDLIQQYVSK